MQPNKASSPTRSMEQFVIDNGLVTEEQLIQAQQLVADSEANLASALMFLKFIEPDRLGNALRDKYGIKQVRVGDFHISPNARKLVSVDQAVAVQVFPMALLDESGGRVLLLAATDPLDSANIARVQMAAKVPVHVFFISLNEIQQLYRTHYRTTLSLFPPQLTNSSESTVKGRLEAVSKPSAPVRSVPNEVLALVQLLVRKGILTEREFNDELRKLRGTAEG